VADRQDRRPVPRPGRRHFDPDLAKMVADGLERTGSRYFSANPGMLF
jgi:hypothetical protein